MEICFSHEGRCPMEPKGTKSLASTSTGYRLCMHTASRQGIMPENNTVEKGIEMAVQNKDWSRLRLK